MATYARIVINGINYFVCASCRRPHRPGTTAPYRFPEPGGAPDWTERRQSLCGACYRTAYAFMYPPRIFPNQPNVPDNALDVEPIPWDLSNIEVKPRTDAELWTEAFALWQQNGGDPEALFSELKAARDQSIPTTEIIDVVEVRR